MIGPDAYPAVPVGGGSAGVRPFAAVSFLEGIANELGPTVHTYYRRGIPELSELAQDTNFFTTESGSSRGLVGEYFSSESLEGEPMLRRTDAHVNFGGSRRGLSALAQLRIQPAQWPRDGPATIPPPTQATTISSCNPLVKLVATIGYMLMAN